MVRKPAIKGLLLVVMAEVGTQEEAEDVCYRVAGQIEQLLEVESTEVKPYWKIAEYYEIVLRLRAKGSVHAAFDALISYASTGWMHGSCEATRWSVWNAEVGVTFLTPDIRWANIEVLTA